MYVDHRGISLFVEIRCCRSRRPIDDRTLRHASLAFQQLRGPMGISQEPSLTTTPKRLYRETPNFVSCVYARASVVEVQASRATRPELYRTHSPSAKSPTLRQLARPRVRSALAVKFRTGRPPSVMTVGNSEHRRMADGLTVPCGPNFFVIGAQKAGTTRLCNLLQRHPSVGIPDKEPWYFQSTRAMAEKAQRYRSTFEGAADVPVRGDGSTSSSMCGIYPGTADRIHEFNPNARIIYMVRHPLRRIESAWRDMLSSPLPARNSIPGGGMTRLLGFEHTLFKTELLIDPSLYWKQLAEYRRLFPDEQIKVSFFEEFIADERAELRACLSFLGVDPFVDIDTDDDEDRNASEGKRQSLVVEALSSLPGYEQVRPFIPQRVRTLFLNHFARPIARTSPWTAESVKWTVSRVSDDSAALLEYAGRKKTYWLMR